MDERFESAVFISQVVDSYGAVGWRRRRLVHAGSWHLIDDRRPRARGCWIAFATKTPVDHGVRSPTTSAARVVFNDIKRAAPLPDEPDRPWAQSQLTQPGSTLAPVNGMPERPATSSPPFSPQPDRCFRMVQSQQLQATHWRRGAEPHVMSEAAVHPTLPTIPRSTN